MKSITIPVKKSPENFVRKYLANRIGNNIRVSKTKFNDNGTWDVSLKAIIPSYVRLRNDSFKTFVYLFDDIGNAVVKRDKNGYSFKEKPSATEIDFSLVRNIEKLTANLQQEILDYGQYSWGKLSSVKYWLGSLHGIIIRCLQENNFPKSRFTDRYQRYFEFLKKNSWIKFEGNGAIQIVAGNKLVKLHEILMSKEGIAEDDLSALADAIIGHIYAKHFNQIRYDLKIHAITSYVITTKAYYADAVREGKEIQMNRESLWLNYRTYNYGYKPPTFKDFRFPRTIAELVSNNFLRKVGDGEYITATPELFERLMPLQDELAQNVMDV